MKERGREAARRTRPNWSRPDSCLDIQGTVFGKPTGPDSASLLERLQPHSGNLVTCAVRGQITFVGLSTGRIPWAAISARLVKARRDNQRWA